MIFITGFHHSGTSFLAEIVEQFGFNFAGPLDRHHEHEELKKLDDELIGDWMHPTEQNFRAMQQLKAPENVEAYKNPRLMLTAAIWNRDYPGSKWIYIEREGCDVITSMMADKTRPQDPLFWIGLINQYSISFSGNTRRLGIPFLVLTYREICQYPQLTASKIGHWLNRQDKIAEVATWIEENAKFKTYAKD